MRNSGHLDRIDERLTALLVALPSSPAVKGLRQVLRHRANSALAHGDVIALEHVFREAQILLRSLTNTTTGFQVVRRPPVQPTEPVVRREAGPGKPGSKYAPGRWSPQSRVREHAPIQYPYGDPLSPGTLEERKAARIAIAAREAEVRRRQLDEAQARDTGPTTMASPVPSGPALDPGYPHASAARPDSRTHRRGQGAAQAVATQPPATVSYVEARAMSLDEFAFAQHAIIRGVTAWCDSEGIVWTKRAMQLMSTALRRAETLGLPRPGRHADMGV